MKIAFAALALIFPALAFAQTVTDGDTLKAEGVTWPPLGHRRPRIAAGVRRWLACWARGYRGPAAPS
jgi:hypothetical protein